MKSKEISNAADQNHSNHSKPHHNREFQFSPRSGFSNGQYGRRWDATVILVSDGRLGFGEIFESRFSTGGLYIRAATIAVIHTSLHAISD
jgi:hypothetical protein